MCYDIKSSKTSRDPFEQLYLSVLAPVNFDVDELQVTILHGFHFNL